jgi:hypothetical protein
MGRGKGFRQSRRSGGEMIGMCVLSIEWYKRGRGVVENDK